MSQKPTSNAFEFVVVSGARARQLLNGCTPRTTGSEKMARLAIKEVREGKVTPLDRQTTAAQERVG